MNRERILNKEVISGKDILETSLYYSKGGMDFFSGGIRKRGYYVAVNVIQEGNGFKTCSPMDGVTHCILEVKSYSEKTLNTLTPPPEIVEKLKQYVLNKRPLKEVI